MIRRWYPWLMVLVAMVLLAACGGRTETPASPSATQSPLAAPSPLPTPAADGATLLQERCTVCHTLDRVESARKTAEEWERTVARMIGRGAKLTEAERAVLVAYLAEHYR